MLAVGETLQGRYRIVREIGAGGMGRVYEGENLLIRRRVAIKVMRGDAGQNPELCARFEREAQIASQIPSDHITEVLDLGELDSGVRFIVMEYLVGESLSARLARLPRIPPRELLGLIRQVLAALGAAHRAGVIHRDVKPDNVFILGEKAGRSDFVKLLDFGISKIRTNSTDAPLTQNGMFVGTPAYMAPEQVSGGEASPLWDLYGVGVMLYRGLTGETPFEGQQLDQLVFRVALGKFDPPSVRVPELDPALNALVCRAMARLPEDRFQNAEQFSAALNAWLADHPSEGEVSAPRPLLRPTQTGLGVPTTRLTTEVSIPSRRRTPAWLTWAGVGVLAAAAAAFVLSRHPSSVAMPAEVEVLAAQPSTQPEAAREPARNPSETTPPAPPPILPSTPEADAPQADHARATPAPSGPATRTSPSRAPRAKAPARAAAAERSTPRRAAPVQEPTDLDPANPASKPPSSPASKARPDWGY